MDDKDRHDCGNPDCLEYRQQQVVDALQVVANEAFGVVRSGAVPGPIEAIEHGLFVLRGYVKNEDEIAQAQRAIENGQTVH